jgi:hypothetical protein
MIKATSIDFAGEWPEGSGLHWTPGETRAVPSVEGAPSGIVAIGGTVDPAADAPQKEAPGGVA